MKVGENNLVVFLCAFALITQTCNGSEHDLEAAQTKHAFGNRPASTNLETQAINRSTHRLQCDDTTLLEAFNPGWVARARTFFTSPAFFSTIGNACFATFITTGSITRKLISNDNGSNSYCTNAEAINMLKITTVCLASVGFVAHCTAFGIKRSRRS